MGGDNAYQQLQEANTPSRKTMVVDDSIDGVNAVEFSDVAA